MSATMGLHRRFLFSDMPSTQRQELCSPDMNCFACGLQTVHVVAQ